jgi:hypothetical protein
MRNEFEKVVTGKFKVSIPRKYKIKKHNPYWMNKLFFLFFKRKIKREFPGLLENNSPDFDCLKGFHTYEVKMGTHSFNFFTEIGNRKPEDMAEFIESQTKYLPALKDITINHCYGKMYGDYSEQMTWIDWWIKRGDCMICLNIQGIGMPSQAVKDDVSNILNSLEYIEE